MARPYQYEPGQGDPTGGGSGDPPIHPPFNGPGGPILVPVITPPGSGGPVLTPVTPVTPTPTGTTATPTNPATPGDVGPILAPVAPGDFLGGVIAWLAQPALLGFPLWANIAAGVVIYKVASKK